MSKHTERAKELRSEVPVSSNCAQTVDNRRRMQLLSLAVTHPVAQDIEQFKQAINNSYH